MAIDNQYRRATRRGELRGGYTTPEINFMARYEENANGGNTRRMGDPTIARPGYTPIGASINGRTQNYYDPAPSARGVRGQGHGDIASARPGVTAEAAATAAEAAATAVDPRTQPGYDRYGGRGAGSGRAVGWAEDSAPTGAPGTAANIESRANARRIVVWDGKHSGTITWKKGGESFQSKDGGETSVQTGFMDKAPVGPDRSNLDSANAENTAAAEVRSVRSRASAIAPMQAVSDTQRTVEKATKDFSGMHKVALAALDSAAKVSQGASSAAAGAAAPDVAPAPAYVPGASPAIPLDKFLGAIPTRGSFPGSNRSSVREAAPAVPRDVSISEDNSTPWWGGMPVQSPAALARANGVADFRAGRAPGDPRLPTIAQPGQPTLPLFSSAGFGSMRDDPLGLADHLSQFE